MQQLELAMGQGVTGVGVGDWELRSSQNRPGAGDTDWEQGVCV